MIDLKKYNVCTSPFLEINLLTEIPDSSFIEFVYTFLKWSHQDLCYDTHMNESFFYVRHHYNRYICLLILHVS